MLRRLAIRRCAAPSQPVFATMVPQSAITPALLAVSTAALANSLAKLTELYNEEKGAAASDNDFKRMLILEACGRNFLRHPSLRVIANAEGFAPFQSPWAEDEAVVRAFTTEATHGDFVKQVAQTKPEFADACNATRTFSGSEIAAVLSTMCENAEVNPKPTCVIADGHAIPVMSKVIQHGLVAQQFEWLLSSHVQKNTCAVRGACFSGGEDVDAKEILEHLGSRTVFVGRDLMPAASDASVVPVFFEAGLLAQLDAFKAGDATATTDSAWCTFAQLASRYPAAKHFLINPEIFALDGDALAAALEITNPFYATNSRLVLSRDQLRAAFGDAQ